MSYGKHVGVNRVSNGSSFIDKDVLAFESLLQIHVNDERITSLLGTPLQLEQLYVGHLFSEGYETSVKQRLLYLRRMNFRTKSMVMVN